MKKTLVAVTAVSALLSSAAANAACKMQQDVQSAGSDEDLAQLLSDEETDFLVDGTELSADELRAQLAAAEQTSEEGDSTVQGQCMNA